MFRKLCKRHRNTFPHICAIVLLIIALVPLYVLEKRGKPVELWYISSIFAIAFALFCYGITAPSAMKKAPLRKQLTALSQDFFGMMWPFSYFYTPKPLHELYPPELLAESLHEQHLEPVPVPLCDVAHTVIDEHGELRSMSDQSPLVAVDQEPPQDAATLPEPASLHPATASESLAYEKAEDDISQPFVERPLVEHPSVAEVTQEAPQAPASAASVTSEYFLMFESILQADKKLSFKEALQILEAKYTSAENGFAGTHTSFYFADGQCFKVKPNGTSSTLAIKTLENRYSAFLKSQKSA